MFAALLAILLAPALSRAGDGSFADISFDQALAQAQREQKVVFIDFFTTWCGPCKKLDQTTWKDPNVQKWLTEKTIALKIDAEKQVDLAKRYKVEGYPTLLLLKPDGTAIDRLVGYRDAKTFLSEVAGALSGKDSLSRSKEKLAGRENDPIARKAYAGELARSGRHEEALNEYLWCFDNGRQSAGFGGVRLSFLLSEIRRLGDRYPEAIKALEQRRDAAEARLREGSESIDDMSESVALNRTLGEGTRILALYERLRTKGVLSLQMRLLLANELVKPLSEAKRYQDLLELVGSGRKHVEQSIKMFNFASHLTKDQDEEQKQMIEQANSFMKRKVVHQAAYFYEALLGTRQTSEASEVAESLIGFDTTGATYAALVEAAARAGDKDAVKALGERALSSLPEKEKAAVNKALQSVTRGR